jgi:tetrahedral aminopeptidase
LYVDKFGNIIARKKGKRPCVMLVAHMDEVGLMISSIDYFGRIYLSSIGYIEPITILGERVTIKTGKGEIYGIITTKEIHNTEEIAKTPTMNDLYIDCGISTQELAKLGVQVGDYVYMAKHYTPLGTKQSGIVCGKAMDDRVGCYILLEVAKKLKTASSEVYYVFTVQEEVGLYGSKTSIYSIDPDYAIAVDVTNADDGNIEKPIKRVGHGPALLIKDAEMIANKCINDFLFDTAKKLKISLQPDVSDFGVSDALNISVSKGGIPSTTIGVPVRNMHTTTGIASLHDIQAVIKILATFLRQPKKICL